MPQKQTFAAMPNAASQDDKFFRFDLVFRRSSSLIEPMLDLEFDTTTQAYVQCGSCPIRHRAVCARCDTDELQELDGIKFYRTVPAGAAIAFEGDDLSVLSSVVSGVAKIEGTMEDGRTQILGLLLPSDFIGRPGRTQVAHDITAVTDVTLCCFRRREFENMVARTPHLTQRLLEMTLDELDAARAWMLLLGRKTAREKIASLLILLLKRQHSPDAIEAAEMLQVELPLSREAIADYVGLTIETVSRQFTSLRKSGVIELDGNRKVLIPDLGALETQSGD